MLKTLKKKKCKITCILTVNKYRFVYEMYLWISIIPVVLPNIKNNVAK